MNAATDTIASIALSDLYLHPLNTRSEPPPADIEALADSIADLGLLQNLAGFLDPAAPSDSARKTGIVAGGRRYRALALLAERDGRDPASVMVPVRVTADEETARIWASAENTARQALHPADEVRAYGRMAARGTDPNAIARAFAVTEKHVRQRLRLAGLPDPVLDQLRAGRITLDQAAALTTGRTREAILAELARVLSSHWAVRAEDIRAKLQGASIAASDRRVRFVGLDAYRAAGGEVQEDLFTDNVRLLDEELLDRLTAEALQAEAERTRAEGWKWVEVLADPSTRYDAARGMESIHRRPVTLPESDQEEYDLLQERAEEEALSEDDLARLQALDARMDGDFDDEDRETAGLWIFLGYRGEVERFGPYRRREDAQGAEGDDSDGVAPIAAPEPRGLPQNLIDDLARIRLAALQHRAAQAHELMLDLLAWQLSGSLWPWHTPLSLTATAQPLDPSKLEGFDLPEILAPAEAEGEREAATAEAFEAFRAKGKRHRNEVLTRALARTLLASGGGRDGFAAHLAGMLHPAPRTIWTPTAAGYLGRLPVAALDDLWRQLVPEGRADWTGKKGDKAKQLHRLFNDQDYREALGLSRDENAAIDSWLPAELRFTQREAADV